MRSVRACPCEATLSFNAPTKLLVCSCGAAPPPPQAHLTCHEPPAETTGFHTTFVAGLPATRLFPSTPRSLPMFLLRAFLRASWIVAAVLFLREGLRTNHRISRIPPKHVVGGPKRASVRPPRRPEGKQKLTRFGPKAARVWKSGLSQTTYFQKFCDFKTV